MDRTLKALSLILSYPTRDLQVAMPEIAAVLASDTRLTALTRRNLRPLADRLATADLYDLEESYVHLFDRSRTLSLNLFEHIHGESRDRGSAMVDLIETYRAAGFEPSGEELPDHLPILLEFLAHSPAEEATAILADAGHILAALAERLVRRETPYAAVFAALLALSGASPEAEVVTEMLAAPEDDPDDLAALDRVWEETQVTFAPDPNAGCPASRDLLSRMDLPNPKAPAAPIPAVQ